MSTGAHGCMFPVTWRRAEIPRTSTANADVRRLGQNIGGFNRSMQHLLFQLIDQELQISHETLYRSLFVQARGVLKKELVGI